MWVAGVGVGWLLFVSAVYAFRIHTMRSGDSRARFSAVSATLATFAHREAVSRNVTVRHTETPAGSSDDEGARVLPFRRPTRDAVARPVELRSHRLSELEPGGSRL